ncbi:PREDICTED: uncharacterized protein LOC109226161 [Nicotiana attenuata]|uniref:High chlorophyll fluorescence 153 n=1 Tax=Nicotiana attenuata TaxID=49451 RepID=A0A1J6JAZ4_NICAT|nr:PREDICTED: uncharacterized protein LOC109226161 [Nicotiana attenuata]OIT08003.1 hypothetical protein A4A49_07648 [Nicotiana attenuata]
MASMILSNSLSSSTTFLRFNEPQRQQLFVCSSSRNTPPFLHFHSRKLKKSSRALRVVTRAGGGISSSSYIFALIFPLSLLAITIFTSARIADNLDQKFLEELAVNQAIMEGEEDDGIVVTPLEEKRATPRTRNRPKREVEPSSK